MDIKESTRLSERQMLQLAEIYQKHECLWKVSDELYKNREAREEAYRQMSETLNITGITPADIPQKIKNLRSSYYAEMKKIEKSIRCGAKKRYSPKVSWFPTAHSFLKNYWHKRESAAMKTNSSFTENVSDEESEALVTKCSEKADTEHSSNEPWVFINTDSEQTYEETNMTIDNAVSTSAKKPKNGTTNLKNDTTYQQVMAKIDSIVNNVSIPLKTEDEFDIFGKYIAATLRTLPWETSIIAKMELQKTLGEIQLQSVRQESINPLGLSENDSSASFKSEHTEFS